MALESTQPLTEKSARELSVSKDIWRIGLTTLSPSCTDCLKILWALWTYLGLQMDSFTIFIMAEELVKP
jgi:hypothetical protein